MGNWKLGAADEPQTLTRESLASLRHGRAAGLSRRTLLRRSLGAGVALWLGETLAGTIGFMWPNLHGGFGSLVTLGTITDVNAAPAVAGATLESGAPAYFQIARAYVQLIDTSRGFIPGESSDGSGIDINVRALYQRCPHLGCKPNFCTKNHWFECACHGSRYDRLGTKIDKLGPAPRSLDRFASGRHRRWRADRQHRQAITLGPLPIALGQPGLIPPTSPTGCI